MSVTEVRIGGYRLLVAIYAFSVAGCGIRVIGYGLWIMGYRYGIQVMGYMLWDTCYGIHAKGYSYRLLVIIEE